MNQAPLNMNRESGRAANQLPVVEEVLRLTEAMQHAARLSNWREVSRLSGVRHPMLMSIGPNQSAAAMALIRRIQAMTDEIAHEARTAQAGLTAEFIEAQRKTEGSRAYLKNAMLWS